MQYTGLNEIRSRFLNFFVEREHTLLTSASLIPREDASLLLINSGMAPLKKYFLGLDKVPHDRATSCQKCIRTPDIERVGHTARHGTYFEMLGNFSFGNYFKHEACRWAWDFIVGEMKLDPARIYVTVFTDDDEAYGIWKDEIGVAPSHISRLGRDDNFWEIGSGPCGPCSEMYYDRGEKYGCGKPDCAPGCDCDRFVEFWNLVFTQFNSDGAGTYTPLEHPNIDTGMGLERLACIMQEVDNLFEVDTVQRIMGHICRIAGVRYKDDPKTDISLRVITDHIRSTVFMIGDGVVPKNEGRGYVLRRLLRRAARHGRLIGIREPFLYKVAQTVMQENETAYPELLENAAYITKVIEVEEAGFARTIDAGIELLSGMTAALEKAGEKCLSGDDAFRLYDTFGFPIDLTREILEEKGLTLDEAGFAARMTEQRERARAARAALGDVSWEDNLLAHISDPTDFIGYATLSGKTRLLAVVSENQLEDATPALGGECVAVLAATPFYAESGGQCGDTGVLTTDSGARLRVTACHKAPRGQVLHTCVVEAGRIQVGDTLTAAVDVERRRAIMRNHTAAHLLHHALRTVLGEHVHQAGQQVDERACRFDFSHFSAMTSEELERVEAMVNANILAALPVSTAEHSVEEAKSLGAMALFGEKYGAVVRVVSAGDVSMELCGGTHAQNTAELGLFKIVRELSVAAGVRRIEAVTGLGVLELLHTEQGRMAEAARALGGPAAEIGPRAAQLAAALKDAQRELDALRRTLSAAKADALWAGAVSVAGFPCLAADLGDAAPDALRQLGDSFKDKGGLALLTSVREGKGSLLVVCSPEALKAGAHAGKLIKGITALVGGSGGGRPDSAMGGADPAVLPKAREAFAALAETMLGASK